jgi:tripartite-type tricarboxylate transporter receptor subunit TctC
LRPSRWPPADSFFAVNPDVPARTLKEFIAYAKANPGKLNYGSQGNGSTLHLAMEQVKRVASLDIVHVPFKTAPDLAAALLAGNIQVAITDFSSVLPLVRAGRVRALAVTSEKRSTAVPEVPTLAEAGLPGVSFISWVGFLAPAGTPAPIVEQLNTAMVSALNMPSVRQAIANAGGSEIFATSPDEFARFITRERAQWSGVIKALGVTAN